MKKIYGMTLAMLVTLGGLVGCSGNNSSTGSGEESATGSGEVIWWNNYQTPDLSKTTEEEARQSSTYREYYYAKDLIEEFQKEYKDITIKMEYKGSYNDIKSAVDAATTAGGLPAMATCYPDSAYPWNEAGAVLNMNDKAKELAKDSDYNQKYLSIEQGMYEEGTLLTLPYSKSAECFVYNKTVFDKVGEGKAGTDTTDSKGNAVYTAPVASASKTKYSVPTNWDELIATARKIKADFPEVFANQRDGDNFFTAVPFCWDSTENMIISLLKNANIPYTANGSTAAQRVLFNNDDAKALVVKLKKWNDEGLICTQNQLPYTNKASGYHAYGSNYFCNGKIFMSISSTAGARYFTNDGFAADMTKTLAWENGSQTTSKVISQGPSLCFFRNKDVNVQNAAFTFYKYLTNKENSAKLAVNTAYFPLRTSAYELDTVKALTDAAKTAPADNASSSEKGKYYAGTVMNLNTKYTNEDSYFLSPVTAESATCRTSIGGLINTVFNTQLDTTAADYDQKVVDTVNKAFASAYTEVTK